MGKRTSIGWTHHTFNPWWGCVEDGPECDHCYARSFAKRTGHAVWGAHAPRRFFGTEHWAEPLKWEREAREAGERRRVFCASMADVGERRNDDVGRELDRLRHELWYLVRNTPELDWLLLTKRPQNLARMLPLTAFPNAWFGTTAGTAAGWQKRVRYVAQSNAVVRFVSVEPMLGDLGPVELEGIDWVICGGESGGRSFDFDWARRLRDRCAAAGVAFFMKQAGTKPLEVEPGSGSVRRLPVAGKGEALRDLPSDLRIRELPTPRAA